MSARLLNGYWVLAVAGVCLLFSAGAYAVDNDGDGIGDDAETLACQDTVIPDVPTQGLKKNRYALTGIPSNTIFESSNNTVFTTVDTGGCSCTQIIAALGLGSGHTKFGCSKSAMLMWADTVQPAAADDTATVTEDDPATVIDVLANDIPATIVSVTDPVNGTAIIIGGGTAVTYEPDADYCNAPPGSSTDDFEYTILGGSPATATVAMTVTCVNDAPVITSDGGGPNATANADENQTAVTTVTATDIDLPAQTLTFSITGGADAAQFSINGSTGVLTFSSAPDFENPTDAGGNNIYDVQVTVTDDGAPTLTDVQDIAVTVGDVNDAPVITSDGGGANASVNVDENTTAVTTVTATDQDLPAQTLTFSITGGADQALFSIVGSTGALTFISAPDFETPLDAGVDNVYNVQVTVTDDGAPNLSDVQDIAVTVDDVNENVAPVITSDGGGATASVNAAENQTAVTTVTATDADVPAQTLTFTISGGVDQSLFGIAGGVLTFLAAPDFENPTDAGGDNVYDVQVTVTDDGTPNLTDVQDIAVTVTDVNDAPVITSDGGGATAAVNAAENQTAVTTVTATDADLPAQTLTFTISGGADQALFGIAGGVLTFISAPDFENPLDAGGDNVYDVQVTVTDNGAPNLSDVQDIAVTVTGANDAPVITSDGGGATASVNAAENQTAVTTVTATDADLPAQTLTFSVSGGADAALFSIVGSTGVLTFNAAPDFENPQDAGGDNVYDVQVTVTDDGAPNLSDVQDIAVTVTGANDAPVITSDGGGANASVNAAENQTAVTTVTATDADLPAQTLTFSITGGADQALFSIVGSTGVLTFNAAPDFENPTDAGANNVYDVQVTVTDNGAPNLSDVQDIAVTVTDVATENVAPVITSDGGGATASVNAAENQTAVTTVTATDADAGDTLTFSITGGADQALFSIVGSTGVLTFNAAPDFENPLDAGGDNVYDVQVTVTDDGVGTLTDVQDIAVTVTNANDAPVGVADSYTGAIGNTDFRLVAAPSGTTPVPPTVELVGSVGDNDSDEDGDTVGAVAGTVGTLQGGSVTIDANGRFVYSPPAGFNGNDTFTYTPSDGVDPATSTSTVTIAVADIVWYVDDSSPNNPGTGTSADPFRDLSSATGAPTAPSDTIFVYAGTQTTGISLQSNQTLLGEGVALIVGPTTLVDAGTRPSIATTGNAITLASGNTVRGIDITGSTTGISGTAFGTLTANTMLISTTGGPGIDLSNGAGAVTLDSLSSSGSSGSSGSGIDLDSVTGSFSFGSGSISGSTNEGINITNSTATISYGGSVAAGGGLAVNISSHSANSVSLSGLITSSGQGILLNNNTGGTINLSGGVSLSTGAFTAFSATNGGTVNVTGTNTVTTDTATAVAIVGTTIGSSDVIFESITSIGASSNVAIILDDTGAGEFMVTGTGGTCAVGTATCTGGTIANKTGDAITLNTTGGRVTLMDMIIEDIGSTGGGFNTRSQHDAIHGEDVLGGLTLNNTLIRRISDMCINGATFVSGLGATTWNGLDIFNSTIEDCNRWHVAGTGDTSDEGAVRIVGLTGTVTVDNSTIQRAGELMDLFTAPTGTLNMTVTDSNFNDAFKEFTTGGTVAIGKFCIDVTVEGSSDANVTIGGAGTFPNNEFINCGVASVRVAKDTTPAGNSNIDVIVDNNQFRVTDQTPANGVFGNTPQGGVVLRAGPGGISTFDGLVSNNVFGVAVGPDDRIGSTTDEIANADGVEGNLALIFESGAGQARVNNNTFNGSINAPWFNRADGNTSAAVLYENNSYRGRDDYCCDGGFTFTVPGIPYRTRVRNGGNLDVSFVNDQFAVHDQFFFAQTENLEFESRVGGGTMCVALSGTSSPDGYEFDELVGTINLFQGAVNNAAIGPCGVGASSDCQNELADDGVRGGPNGYSQAGAPNSALNPPFVDVDNGSIAIVGTACTLPSGGIFD